MSIESKHAYRFEFLKSDKWSSVRLATLAREDARCQICGDRSLSNDAHHIWYPKNIWDTTPDHLVILCRSCHNFTHAMLPECKTNDEAAGKSEWLKLRNALSAWRIEKISLFQNDKSLTFNPRQLREAYNKLKEENEKLLELVQSTDINVTAALNGSAGHATQLKVVLGIIRKWAEAAHESLT